MTFAQFATKRGVRVVRSIEVLGGRIRLFSAIKQRSHRILPIYARLAVAP